MEMVSVSDVIERQNNYPVDGQDYTVGQVEDGRYFFSWGYRWPSRDGVPAEEVEEAQNGVHWHSSREEALDDMRGAMEYLDADDGGYNPYERNDIYWPEAF